METRCAEHCPLAPRDTERAERRDAPMRKLGSLAPTTDGRNTAMSRQSQDERRLEGHGAPALRGKLPREAGETWKVEAIEAPA